MKASFKRSVYLIVLFVGCGLMSTVELRAQTPPYLSSITNLHIFNHTNDGYLVGGLVLSGNTLYGTTVTGGSNQSGTIYSVNTDGSGFSNLYTFSQRSSAQAFPTNLPYMGTNLDGAGPQCTLAFSGNFLYGMTGGGGLPATSSGTSGAGVIFKINTDGSGFAVLHYFKPYPDAYIGNFFPYGLVLLGNTLYGATPSGGVQGGGAIFSVNTDGSGYTNLYSWNDSINGFPPPAGTQPVGVTISSNKIFGATGLFLFSMNLDGSGFFFIHSNSCSSTLALSGQTLFGAAGSSIFAVNTDGTGYTNLYTLVSLAYDNEGTYLQGLTCSGNVLFGVAQQGGGSYKDINTQGGGTIFTLNKNGTGFHVMHSFSNGVPDANPVATLLLSGNHLYGTTYGSAFDLSFILSAPATPSLSTVARFFRITGPTATSINSFQSDGSMIWSNAQPGATYTVQTCFTLTGLSNWVDYVQLPTTNSIHTNKLCDFNPPSGMVFIPGGSFMMGDNLDGETDAVPVLTTVSPFYMDYYKVTGSIWHSVYAWAGTNGYSFSVGDGAGNTPKLSWKFDSMKWCNARSQMEGLDMVYFSDPNLTQPYHSGTRGVTVYAKWSANGYRLPTEAEWEKGARSGLNGQRFPWGNFISSNLANYYGDTPVDFTFDLGPDKNVRGADTPTGYFPPNGYGLYDMAGNEFEYVWDFYAPTYSGGVDPHGPLATSGNYIMRGGDWYYGDKAYYCRCANRQQHGGLDSDAVDLRAFRCVRKF